MGPFLLGCTAADIQVITGQRRHETHFYRIPPTPNLHAWESMKLAYPELADPYILPCKQAAFISGYLMHLVWDEAWAWEVFCPLYLESKIWESHQIRSIHHNALRVLLDREAEKDLHALPELNPLLRKTEPESWLPFAPDAALCQWRDWITNQLDNPQDVQTAKVFAQRMHIPTEQLEDVIKAIAAHTCKPAIPGLKAAIRNFEARATTDSLTVLHEYWQSKKKKTEYKTQIAVPCIH